MAFMAAMLNFQLGLISLRTISTSCQVHRWNMCWYYIIFCRRIDSILFSRSSPWKSSWISNYTNIIQHHLQGIPSTMAKIPCQYDILFWRSNDNNISKLFFLDGRHDRPIGIWIDYMYIVMKDHKQAISGILVNISCRSDHLFWKCIYIFILPH